MLFHNRVRAGSFGDAAERYDRSRPSYPPGLIDDLMALGPHSVLDVGCGTGKAGVLLRDRGCAVLGVEADARMAAVAASRGLEMEVSPFEDWDPRGRRYDLVVSAQAWHWIDPVAGAAKAAEVLVPGGHLALAWNEGQYEDEDALTALRGVYEQHAPQLHADAISTRRDKMDDRVDLDAIATTPGFGATEIRTYEWLQPYTTDQWIDMLGTHSDHATLPEAQRDALLEAVDRAVDGMGGTLLLRYRTALLLTPRI